MNRDREVRTLSTDIAVVGGGVTGLAAAHRLVEVGRETGREFRVAVLERSPRAGGSIWTERSEHALIEAGPDQFVTSKPAALELCQRLGLGPEIMSFDGSRAAMQVVHRGRPVPLPAGLEGVVPSRLMPLLGSRLFTWRGRARTAFEPFVRRGPASEDESVASFIERRFGRELHERVVEPIVGGIYTADTRRLSAEFALPRLRALEREHGSLGRGVLARRAGTPGRGGAGVATLRGGLGRLVERLVSRLPEGCIVRQADVSGIRPAREGRFGGRSPGWLLDLGGKRELAARVVVLAVPAPMCADLLRPLDADLGARLGAIEHASCATVSLLYPLAAVGRSLEGYGFFVPAAAGLALLACSYVSRKFPDRAAADQVLFRVFLGGAHHPRTLDMDDAGLARLAHRSLVGLLAIESEPLMERVFRFPRAMPQYGVGFRSEAARIAERLEHHPGLVLGGSAVGAFGLPDCIASGERAAVQAWELAALHEAAPAAAAANGGR